MNNLIRYGTVEHVQIIGDTVKVDKHVFHDWQESTKHSNYSESVPVKGFDEALAIFLHLLDEAKEGKIKDPGVQLHQNKAGNVTRIERLWTV